MHNPLTRKLQSFTPLGPAEREALSRLCASSQRRTAGEPLIKEGDRPENVFLLLEGWAFRYKHLRDGSRQITAFLIPGDLCDPHIFILAEMDHSIGLLSDASVMQIPKQTILDLTERFPAIARALWWSALVDEAVLREWLLNIGQRDAYERIAHLFMELWTRMNQVGLTSDGRFSLPLTQEQLGDTVGLTSVHVNRVLGRMREEKLITLHARHLTILDEKKMRAIADFDPKYLHLQPRV